MFHGLGKLKNYQVKLHIEEDIQEQLLHDEDIQEQLLHDEELGVMERITGPTPWVSPIVVATKSPGKIRVCVDIRQANKAIKSSPRL